MMNDDNRLAAKRETEANKQPRGVCEYPANGNEPCGMSCATCDYFHMPYMKPRSSRMRHISEVLDEVMRDLSEMRVSQ